MTGLTVQEIAAATRRGALALASDPEVKHYSADTLALVYERTVMNLAGAGDLARMAKRMVDDPALVGVPFPVVEAVMTASFRHFTRAIAAQSNGMPS